MIATVSRSRAAHAAGWLAVIVTLLVLVPSAASAGVSVGKVQITTPSGSAISGGGSHTIFSVSPPAGAKCPGDTAHKFFHVDSYFVRKGISPTAVNFKGGLPSLGFGLISDGAYYGAINTARDTGAILIIPAHSIWDRLSTKMLFPHGEHSTLWQTGIACADTNGVVTNYWNAELEFTPSSSDPRGFHWTIVDAASSSGHSSNTPLILALIVVGAVVIGLVVRSRSRRTREQSGAGR